MPQYKKPYLQPYRGKATLHDCPSCGKKKCFKLYINGNTYEPIHPTVGKCNHAVSCGYHYPPRQYFLDHPEWRNDAKNFVSNRPKTRASNYLFAPKPEVSHDQPPGLIPFTYVEKSASYRSHFVRFLCELITEEQIRWIGENYALGATRNSEVIFWQIDITGKVRTGKIMQYNPETGKRIKHESGAIDWVHNKLKYSGKLPKDFNLKQCFFGEHLLKIYPDKSVAIAESEKNAVIASVFYPELIWLSCGNLNGLSVEKCKVLKGRNVILFPDLKVFDIWSEKAREIQKQYHCTIRVSNLLENIASDEDKERGLDIADFLIRYNKESKSEGIRISAQDLNPAQELTQSTAFTTEYVPTTDNPKYSQTLNKFRNINPAVGNLMESLSLEEFDEKN